MNQGTLRRQITKSRSDRSCVGYSQKKLSLLGRTMEKEEKLGRQEKVIEVSKRIPILKRQLTDHEQAESSKFEAIYYVGTGSNSESNDSDEVTLPISKHDQIGYRYEVLNFIGEGAFSQVFSGIDHKTSEHVAIKIIKNQSNFYEKSLREVEILSVLKRFYQSSNVAYEAKDSFTFRKHRVLVFPLYYANLRQFIRQKEPNLQQIMSVCKQILTGLLQIHSKGIIHCDVKPENIMFLNEASTQIKMIDFGSAVTKRDKMIKYVQSRYYRAPEVVLGYPYSSAIDMWSFGCVLAEIWIGRPLFNCPDENSLLQSVIDVIGSPPHSMIEYAPRKHIFQLRMNIHKKLRTVIDHKEVLELVEDCLEWEPDFRITAEQALNKPFLNRDQPFNFNHLL